MSRVSQHAAAAQIRQINARLAPDELHIMEAMVGRKEGLLATARALRLRKDEAIALLQRACEKVSAYYAEHDARAARQTGRLH